MEIYLLNRFCKPIRVTIKSRHAEVLGDYSFSFLDPDFRNN